MIQIYYRETPNQTFDLLVSVSHVSRHCPRERGNETWTNRRGNEITTQADGHEHTRAHTHTHTHTHTGRQKMDTFLTLLRTLACRFDFFFCRVTHEHTHTHTHTHTLRLGEMYSMTYVFLLLLESGCSYLRQSFLPCLLELLSVILTHTWLEQRFQTGPPSILSKFTSFSSSSHAARLPEPPCFVVFKIFSSASSLGQ